LNEVLDDENICECSLEDDSVFNDDIHSWWLQEPMWSMTVRMIMVVKNGINKT
jgi:hypothetical protein